jgi:hypothetical protein
LHKEEYFEFSAKALEILEKEKITDRAFLKMIEEIRSYGMLDRPTTGLVVKELDYAQFIIRNLKILEGIYSNDKVSPFVSGKLGAKDVLC